MNQPLPYDGTRPPTLSEVPHWLSGLDQAGVIDYRGIRPRRGFTLTLPPARARTLSRDKMTAWLYGFTAGHAAEISNPRPLPVEQCPPLPRLRSVLVAPSLEDQYRLRIWAAMETAGVTVARLAEMLGRNKKTITEALVYGRPGHLSMLAALGQDPLVTPATDLGHTVTLHTPTGRVEPVGLRRARLLVGSHERRLLKLVGPLGANEAQAAATFIVDSGACQHAVAAEGVEPWILGFADAVDPDLAEQLHRIPALRT